MSTSATPQSGHANRTGLSKVWLLEALTRFRSLDQRGTMLLFCLCTAAITLAFFSASVSKLLPYTLPAFPAVAIMLGCFIDELIAEKKNKPISIGFTVLAFAFGIGLLVAPHAISKLRDCPPGLSSMISGALCTMCASSVIAFIASLMRRPGAAVAAFATMLIAATVFFGSQAMTILADYWEEPIKAYSNFVAGSNWPIVVFQARKPSVTFYTHRKVVYTDAKSELTKAMDANAHGYVISRIKSASALKELGCRILSTQGTAVLATWNK